MAGGCVAPSLPVRVLLVTVAETLSMPPQCKQLLLFLVDVANLSDKQIKEDFSWLTV